MSPVVTAVSATTLSGYVDTSAMWKFGTGTTGTYDAAGNLTGRTSDTMPGRFNDGANKSDRFSLNAVNVVLERPLGEEDWAAGYKVDLMFGPDAVAYNPSLGAANGDFAVKQAYVDLLLPAGNGVDIKMGVFNTVVGYEVYDSYVNPNWGRSFGWQLEPTQHTGVLASYDLSEAVSVSFGIANTYAPGINTTSPRGESHKAYMGAIAINAPESWGFMAGSSLYAGVVDGFAGNTKDTVLAYVGGTLMTPVEGLGIGAAFDYRFNGPTTGVGGGALSSNGESWAYAIAGYLTYRATEKLSLNGRVDFTTASDGTWFDGGTADISDRENQLLALTGTLDYALWANVITRAELRWDTSLNDDAPYGIDDKNAITLAANVIFKF